MTTGKRTDNKSAAQPQGAPPSPQELKSWARGELPAPREAEIKSHIALDNRVFDTAMTAYSDHQNNQVTGTRWTLKGVAPFALAATLALAVGLYFPNSETLEDVADPVLRSGAAEYVDPRVAAFNAGFSSKQSVTREIACGANRCNSEQLMRVYGNTLRRLTMRCEAPTADARTTLAALSKSFAANAELAIWQADLKAIASASEASNFAATCKLSQQVLDTYLY